VIRVTVSDHQTPPETAPYGTQMARPALCPSREDIGAMLKNGKAPPARRPEALNSLRGLRYPGMATKPV